MVIILLLLAVLAANAARQGKLVHWLSHAFNNLSQFANVLLLAGHSNESISGRCYREGWEVPMKIINGIFFWQNHHCRGAHFKDVEWAKEIVEYTKERIEGPGS